MEGRVRQGGDGWAGSWGWGFAARGLRGLIPGQRGARRRMEGREGHVKRQQAELDAEGQCKAK